MIRIVLVEDHEMFREGIRVILSQVPEFSVVKEFSNGQEVIDEIDNIEFDIIIMDIEMPKVDGIKATKLLTARNPHTKIIALSMYSDSKYYYELITAGVKGFVLKQSSYKELESAIKQVSTGGSFFSDKLLYNVILNMKSIENTLVEEKKNLLRISTLEVDLLNNVCKGLSNKELADVLCVSVKTIESNKAKLMRKTGAKNNAGLIIWAIKNKVVQL